MVLDTNTLMMLIPLLLLQALLAIFCIFKIFKGSVKYLPKWLWAILCLNTLGAIVFLILGRGDE